jgi:hypothetical protein
LFVSISLSGRGSDIGTGSEIRTQTSGFVDGDDQDHEYGEQPVPVDN